MQSSDKFDYDKSFKKLCLVVDDDDVAADIKKKIYDVDKKLGIFKQ